MFPGFVQQTIPTSRGRVFVKTGGNGPPILLLHGYPQTHLMWRDVAPALAEQYTVVVADLPGYGASFRPQPSPDHRAHSKRALGVDLVETMQTLGHERFAVAGHDRGGRVAYRMALDHSDRVQVVGAFDVVPTGEVWSRADARMALAYWHWAFLAQPAPMPERMIATEPGLFFDVHVRALGLGHAPGRYPPEVMAVYRRLLNDTSYIQAVCEDYRAGATVDRSDDDEDRAKGRAIGSPVLLLWSARGALPAFYGDVFEVRRPWAPDVRGRDLDASHFLVEDQPEEVTAELVALMRSVFPG